MALQAGDPVIYLPNAALYGEMEVLQIMKHDRVICLVDPDSKHPDYEIFDVSEVAAA